jgi:hypothetical protein
MVPIEGERRRWYQHNLETTKKPTPKIGIK